MKLISYPRICFSAISVKRGAVNVGLLLWQGRNNTPTTIKTRRALKKKVPLLQWVNQSNVEILGTEQR
jgi:hypothetical protein